MKAVTKTLLALAVSLLPLTVHAQPGAVNPPVIACGKQSDAELICGTRSPEDFEPTPDGKYLIVAKFAKGDDSSFDLFDLVSQKFTHPALVDELKAGWGDAACKSSIGSQVVPHGLSLVKRTDGAWQLFVVNHTGRESMEMYEPRPSGATWQLVWHGCVLADKPYNDVAGLPDGGFVATRPTAIQKEGQDLFKGEPSGNLSEWHPGGKELVLPGSEYGYPNGVIVSSDGRYAYVSGWTSKDVHQYDLKAKKEVAKVALSFMPDNLTWAPGGKMLAAGVKGVNGNCPANSSMPCIQGFGVAEIDPATLKATQLYDSAGKAYINGVSVALRVGNAIYIGSFQSDRIVKLAR